jgi:hypothetical protein
MAKSNRVYPKEALPVYEHERECWGEKTCARIANHTARDGSGTPYPFKGYIGSSASVPAAYGLTIYNGGTSINGKWYRSVHRPLPKVADGYQIITVATWGWRLVHTEKENASK